MRYVVMSVVATLWLLASGCTGIDSLTIGAGGHPHARGRGHGPPPHAPAHGYRHKAQRHGAELEFDSGLGVYVVVGVPLHYYLDGLYLRLDGR